MGPIKLTRWQSPGTVFQSSLVSLGTYTAATLLMKVGIFGEIKGLKSECHPGAEKKSVSQSFSGRNAPRKKRPQWTCCPWKARARISGQNSATSASCDSATSAR